MKTKSILVELLLIYMSIAALLYTNLVVMTAQPKLPKIVQCPTCGTTHELEEEWIVTKCGYTNFVYCETCGTNWIIQAK